jgi:hypothetical protein
MAGDPEGYPFLAKYGPSEKVDGHGGVHTGIGAKDVETRGRPPCEIGPEMRLLRGGRPPAADRSRHAQVRRWL